MTQFADTTLAAAADLKPGDFVEVTPSWRGTGSRGGRYANPAYRINSALVSATYAGRGIRSADGGPILNLKFVSGALVAVPADAQLTARRVLASA